MKVATVKLEKSKGEQMGIRSFCTTFCRLNVVVRSQPLLREVGRNGETISPRGSAIPSLPIVWIWSDLAGKSNPVLPTARRTTRPRDDSKLGLFLIFWDCSLFVL